MSIPKQPRQLMINIMYIVLTAMLALNVSVEILDAFKLLNGELDRSNEIIDNQNKVLPKAIAKYAKKDWRQYEVYANRADDARDISAEFIESIDGLIEKLIDESGNKNGFVDDGDYIVELDEEGIETSRKLRGEKDKDVPTRILVGNNPSENSGEGAALESLIEAYKNQFLLLVDTSDRVEMESKITLNVDEDWRTSDKSNWSHYNFHQMPLGAVLPMLSKIKYDTKNSENVLLNYLLNKVGASEDVIAKEFEVVSSPIKNYVISGDKYESEIYLGVVDIASSGLKIKVNGKEVPVRNGKAIYSVTATENGIQKYTVESSIYNPVEDTHDTDKKTFEYEVGEQFTNVAATAMNVIYIGVDNPISVAAAGVPSESIRVTSKDIKLKKISPFEYIATATRPTKNAVISVSGKGLDKTDFIYRVKKISDPVPILGKGPNKTGGTMGNAEFKAQLGLGTMLQNFEWDVNCVIQGYELTRQAKLADPMSAINSRGKYVGQAKRLVQQARPGDIYYFDNIKVKCPGDKIGRRLSSVVFKIR